MLSGRLLRTTVTALATLAGLLVSSPAASVGSDHPLQPPDRSSPRATLQTFQDSIDEAWTRYQRDDPSYRRFVQAALGCLDTSSIPPRVAAEASLETALLLKEILDRLELPPIEAIPDAGDVEERNLSRWVLPNTEITLVRAEEGEKAGQFLFSSSTVERSKEFYERVRTLPYQPGRSGAHYDYLRFGGRSTATGRLIKLLPPWTKREFRGQLLWQWLFALGLLVLGSIVIGTSFRFGRTVSTRELERRDAARWGPLLFPVTALVTTQVVKSLLHRTFSLAGLPYYYTILVLTAIGYFATAWLLAVLLHRLGETVARVSQSADRPLNRQLIRISFRVFTIVLVTAYILVAGQSLGLPVPALLAGLGVGGLAVALAAQSTLENFIAGIILFTDQPVRVGDLFRSGDHIGYVEEIGLRSTRIRTLGRSILTIPNAQFAALEIENLTRRDQTRLRTLVQIHYDTTPDQLRFVLHRLEQMLREHPKIAESLLRVRLVGFSQTSLDVEVNAYATTVDWNEFLAIRQDVLLRIMSIVESAGTRLAVPIQVELQGTDTALDDERSRAAEHQIREWRERGDSHLPEFDSPGHEERQP